MEVSFAFAVMVESLAADCDIQLAQYFLTTVPIITPDAKTMQLLLKTTLGSAQDDHGQH